MFIPGNSYTKKEIYKLLSIPQDKQRGNWETGYTSYENVFYLFVNIGISGRSGHNYPNKWTDDKKNKLEWYGKSKTNLRQNQIKQLISGNYPIRIFTREDNRMPFVYQGLGTPLETKDTTPVKIAWQIIDENYNPYEVNPVEDNILKEGKVEYAVITKYERNNEARKKCIEHYGYKCYICRFDFRKKYGEIGKDYIHVHHLNPISDIKEEYVIDPIKDLIPICPNCHAIIHLTNPPLSIDEIKNLIRENE